MSKKAPPEEMTISGFVAATEWDSDDNIIGLEISTDDEDYVVENNRLFDELVELWQEDIEATGIVSEDRDGTKRISITSYEVINEFDDGDEEVSGYDDFDDDIDYEDEKDEITIH